MLKINPILGIKDGEVFPFGQERSRNKAMQNQNNFVCGYSYIDGLAVEDATTPDEAGVLVERIKGVFPDGPVYHSKVSPVIGTNFGPRIIGVAVMGDRLDNRTFIRIFIVNHGYSIMMPGPWNNEWRTATQDYRAGTKKGI